MEEMELDFCGENPDAEAKFMAKRFNVGVSRLPMEKWVNGFPVFKFVGSKANLDKLFEYYDAGKGMADEIY